MGYNERYFDIAYRKIGLRHSESLSAAERRREEVYKKIPEYYELEKQLADTSKKLITIIVERLNVPERVSALEKENLYIQDSMKQLMRKAGFPDNYLEPAFHCEKCGDTGIYKGRWCECFNRLMLSAAAEDLNAVSPLKVSTFESFHIEYYPRERDEELGADQRTIMTKNYEFCRKYADEFKVHSKGIFMIGATGLGKTHLSLAIADAVMRKGFSVIYGSVPELLRTVEKEYFGKSDNDTMQTLINCDLLILDDLGAEMDKPLYTSLLYEIINSRISRSIPLIVNTNLTGKEIKNRYQDRIWSRLFSFEVLFFCGNDIRTRLA